MTIGFGSVLVSWTVCRVTGFTGAGRKRTTGEVDLAFGAGSFTAEPLAPEEDDAPALKPRLDHAPTEGRQDWSSFIGASPVEPVDG